MIHPLSSVGQPPHTPERAYTIRAEGIPVTIKGRTCGYLMPDGTYYKRIEGSRHIIRKLHGIGFSNDVIALAEQMGASRIRVVDADTGIEYLSTFAKLRAEGIAWNDRIFGAQLVLRCNQFAQRLPSGALIQPKNTTQPESTQLNMFEVAA